MKLLYRMLLAPLAAVILLGLAGVVALSSIDTIGERFEDLQTRELKVSTALARQAQRLAAANTALYRTVVVIESLDEAGIANAKNKVRDEVNAGSAELKALQGLLPATSTTQLNAAIAALDKFLPMALGAVDASVTNPGTAQSMLSNASRAFQEAGTALQAVAQATDESARQMSDSVRGTARRATGLIVSITVAAIVLAAGLAFWSARSVVHRIALALDVSRALANGQLDVPVPVAVGGDEMGRLLTSLRETVGRLALSMRDIQSASDSIHGASSEIAQGSSDLSSRTENAASSLELTATSVVQLSTTVGRSAEAAQAASRLALDASHTAERGGQVVSDVVQTMNQIDASSRRVFDIISVIDGIAFQTNILSLNAAVEAARAGEQGRGFAVVASEVRSLAQRSAAAAKEIKALIGESVERVSAGSRLVSQAGQTMTEIVQSVQQVCATIDQVSGMAVEQSAGLSEVQRAVGALDATTQQNAAMAEQSAAASERLKDQASRLNQVVSQFRLPTSV